MLASSSLRRLIELGLLWLGLGFLVMGGGQRRMRLAEEENAAEIVDPVAF